MESKKEVRAAVAARRGRVTPHERNINDAVICAATCGAVTEIALQRGWRPSPGAKAPLTVCAYMPIGSEAGGPGLVEYLDQAAERLLLPVTPDEGPLEWAQFTSMSELQPGRYGIPEPIGPRLGTDAIASADAVVVPAMACDRSGNRLGRGGGFYDRTLELASPSALLLCVLDAGDVLDQVPTEPHDRPVDAVITQDGIVRFSRRGVGE